MATMEHKVNALLCFVEALKKRAAKNKEKVSCKLSQLESDVVASQDSTTQHICKKLKWK